jgi:membrane associated rhomboid family serine protease
VLFPFGTDRSLVRPTLVTYFLIALNVGVFVALAFLERSDAARASQIGEFLWLNPGSPRPWSFVSYAFLHADLLHILGNMLFLWVFGPNVEDRFGRIGFLAFYLVAGAGAGGLHAFFNDSPVVGASGAIAGVTGAYLVLFPYTRIKTLVFFFFIGIAWIPAVWFIGARILWDLAVEGMGRSGNVATLAHLGGYAVGSGLSMCLLWWRILGREPYDLFTMTRQASRRRQFREVAYRQRTAAAPPQDSGQTEAVAAARAEVSRCLSSLDLPGAAVAYRRLLSEHGAVTGAGVLSRRHQYDLANHLFQAGDYPLAAVAYERFLGAYPGDSEAPQIRLLLGRINARYLNDPIEAKRLLSEAVGQLRDEDSLALARRELADLG